VFLESVYCLGSVFGPGIGSFISFRTNILGWEINEGNSPGIVLAVIYLLFLVASLFLPKGSWVESGARNKIESSNISDCEDEKKNINYQDGDQKLTEDIPVENPSTLLDSRIFGLLFLIFSSEVFSSTATFYIIYTVTVYLSSSRFRIHRGTKAFRTRIVDGNNCHLIPHLFGFLLESSN
jgi:hypothetical protein